MRKSILTVLGATAMLFTTPSIAQEVPLIPGDYWEVAEIDIHDGQFAAYADYVASRWRQNQEFAKSKGWIKDYKILAVNNRRADEPDLYLVTIFDDMPNAAQQLQREKEFNAFMATSSRQAIGESGTRAKYRKLSGSMLLQEMLFRR